MTNATFNGRFSWHQERLSTGKIVQPITSNPPWPGSPETYIIVQVCKGEEGIGHIHCRTTENPEVMEIVVIDKYGKLVMRELTTQQPDEKATMRVASLYANKYMEEAKIWKV